MIVFSLKFDNAKEAIEVLSSMGFATEAQTKAATEAIGFIQEPKAESADE